MLPEEQQAVQGVLAQASQVPAQRPNPQLETLIRQSVGGRPDAMSVLVQLLAYKEMQLQQAAQTINGLQQQPQSAPVNYGNQGRPSLWNRGSAQPFQQHQGQQPGGYSNPFGGGSFLGNVATTAVGVVAGQAAFSALGSLFGGGHQAVNSALSNPTETVNNYFMGDSGSGSEGGGGDDSGDSFF